MRLVGISHLASAGAPTGAERSLAGLLEALAARGHETAAIAPGRWCLTGRLEGAGVPVAEIPSRACWLVQWTGQPAALQLGRYLRWRAPDPGVRRMMVWLDRFWPDVVHVNCLPQLKGAAAAAALGLPVVWHVREILPPGRRRRWFARRLARDARHIVAVSGAVAEWLDEEGLGDRVTVVRNGVASPPARADRAAVRASLGLPGDGVVVGFLGGAAVHKGVGHFLDAVEEAAELAPGLAVVLPVYGPTAEVEALRRRVADSPASERIRLVSPVDDVFGLLGAVDLVAFTSIWPDSLPRVVMEAMAAGRPVVAYRTGGVAEMVVEGETGLMVPPGDTSGLAERIVRLAGDGALRRRLGETAAVRARAELSLERHLDAMERVLERAASR
ncbi:MAG: glycosyltransferase family 4 protein [Thermoanaerobaculales bacterium]|jgi:glycosyltransferase involved in cell wall biosynthesis|nr:glycosyltransferase family 4 protein [Thermoanaerobaculales bacterium]